MKTSEENHDGTMGGSDSIGRGDCLVHRGCDDVKDDFQSLGQLLAKIVERIKNGDGKPDLIRPQVRPPERTGEVADD